MISFYGSVTRTTSVLLYFVLLECHVMFLAGRYACERACVCVGGRGEGLMQGRQVTAIKDSCAVV